MKYTEDTERFKGIKTAELEMDIHDMLDVWAQRKREALPRCPVHHNGPPRFGCSGCVQQRDGLAYLRAAALVGDPLFPESFVDIMGLDAPGGAT